MRIKRRTLRVDLIRLRESQVVGKLAVKRHEEMTPLRH